jgi:hypothetical protein
MNATCERLIGTLRRELLDRMLILGERHLRTVLTDYQAHYHTARPHQGIAQHVPDSERDAHRAAVTDIGAQQIRRKPIFNGLINEYTHAAGRTEDLQVTGRILFRAGQDRHFQVLRRPGHPRILRPYWLHQAARQWLGSQPVELSAGHCPHVSQPETIADILVRV